VACYLAAQQGRDVAGLRPWAEEAAAIQRECGDTLGLFHDLTWVASTAAAQGDQAAADAAAAEVRALAGQLGTPLASGWALSLSARLELAVGDVARARTHYAESAALLRDQ